MQNPYTSKPLHRRWHQRIPSARWLLLLAMPNLAACQAIDVQAIEIGQTIEPLYAIEITAEHLTIGVRSTGCTRAEHFHIHQTTLTEATELQVERIVKDRCRRAPTLKYVTLPWPKPATIHNTPVLIRNPIRHPDF